MKRTIKDNIIFEYEEMQGPKFYKEYLEFYIEMDKNLWEYTWYNNIKIEGVTSSLCLDETTGPKGEDFVGMWWSIENQRDYLTKKEYDKIMESTFQRLSKIFKKAKKEMDKKGVK